MFLSMNWIQDFVDLSGLDKIELIRKFSLSTAEVENDILRKGSEISGIVVGEIKSVENHPDSKKLHLLKNNIVNFVNILKVCAVLYIVCNFHNAGVIIADTDFSFTAAHTV